MAPHRAPGTLGVSRESRRVRMTGPERREQLLDVGRTVFAEKGFDATTIEEIAERAGVTKPVVYEHFGGKDRLYEQVVDREVLELLGRITQGLEDAHPRARLEGAATAFLSYIEEEPAGFRVLVRDVPAVSSTGTFASVIGDVASRVEFIFDEEFTSRDFDPALAPLYSQALVGMIALVGQWWLETGKPERDDVAAHLVNLAWNGLAGLESKPRLRTKRRRS